MPKDLHSFLREYEASYPEDAETAARLLERVKERLNVFF